jgi:release factor glutamine methyltransferase
VCAPIFELNVETRSLWLNRFVQLGQALRTAIQQLIDARVPSPRMNAELLLMFVLGCDRADLYGHPERLLTDADQSRYAEALAQRTRGLPAQYITGHQEFWGMDLLVSPAVLIPRPETEHVLEKVLELARTMTSVSYQSRAQGLQIIDVGTGSGCIALALAKELPHAEIRATDISLEALQIARANAARHQLQDRVHFHQADLLAGIEQNAFDILVSNPPYVGESEEDQVQMEVRKFEPRNAVFAGRTGLEVISRLVPEAATVLTPNGWLVMEISGAIAERARSLVAGWQNVQITKDLQSIPRVLSAQNCTAVRG